MKPSKLFLLFVPLALITVGCTSKTTATLVPETEKIQSAPALITEATTPPVREAVTAGPATLMMGNGEEATPQPKVTQSMAVVTSNPLPEITSLPEVSATPGDLAANSSGSAASETNQSPTRDTGQSSPSSTATTSDQTGAETTGCVDMATFEGDVNVPDNTLFRQGESFVKTWRLYNSGTCPWSPGYSVVLAYGDPLGSSTSYALPVAAPGTSINVSVQMTAPNTAGQYAGNWQLQNSNGRRFGVGKNGNGYFWVQIMVSYVTPEEASLPDAASSASTPIQVNTTDTSSATSSIGCSYNQNSDFEREILDQINTIRSSYGLPTLTMQAQLSAAALRYSIDMACNNRVDFTRHTDSMGGRWYDRIRSQNYDYTNAFENVYAGNPSYGGTPQGAMNWWMNSLIHRENILNPDVSEIGISYIYTSNSDYGGYYTVDFATP